MALLYCVLVVCVERTPLLCSKSKQVSVARLLVWLVVTARTKKDENKPMRTALVARKPVKNSMPGTVNEVLVCDMSTLPGCYVVLSMLRPTSLTAPVMLCVNQQGVVR